MQMEETLNTAWEEPSNDISNDERPMSIRKISKASIVMNATLLFLAIVSIYAFFTFDYKNVNLIEAFSSTFYNLKIVFLEPHLKHFSVHETIWQLIVTLGLTVLTTLIGSVIALFFGLFAAQNLSTKLASNIIKAVVAFIRAVPTVLWVLIFAVAAGLGSVAAVIGITFHTIGYLIKAFSESFEELDKGVIEALKGSGANWWQIVFQAVIPSCASYLISWTFLRFEINFTYAILMGAAAGAGGIGFDLYMAGGHYFDLREVGFITYIILAVALVLEVISTRMKVKLSGFD
ncbi:MAG: ABC transporter permease subunit [Clostridia bacterium]|nr:ABC transporter permease subunit [Clostridia bacterium]